MTITLKNSGADISLCDDASYAGQNGYFIGPLGDGVTEADWQVQMSMALRAATQTPYDRLNAAYVLNFQVYVQFASEALATSFRFGWLASLPRTSTWLFVRHSTTLSQTFTPAILKSCRIVQTGLGCVLDYKWNTGAPTTGA